MKMLLGQQQSIGPVQETTQAVPSVWGPCLTLVEDEEMSC